VDVKRTEAPGSLDLEFSIHEGLRQTVMKIDIRGNNYFPAKQIKGEMSLSEPGWFTSSPYREDLLNKDMDYIHDRYMDSGFLAVSVKKKVTFVDDTKAVIEIDIDEEPQTRAETVTFEKNSAFPAAELLGIVSLKPGAPYNERLVDEDRYRILSAYSNKGYLYAKVDVEKKTADGTVDIQYKISEDHQVKIGRIILRGNANTKDNVIMRELLVKPGGPMITGLSSRASSGYTGSAISARLGSNHCTRKKKRMSRICC
jgi:outer membrane protein insertion porin family